MGIFSRRRPSSFAIATALLLSHQAAEAACPELKLGVIGVLSGPAAQWGLALKGAAEFVAAEANRDNQIKIDGEPCHVSIVAIDSKYSAEGAAAAGNSMAGQGIKFIIGPIGSPEMTGLKPIAVRNAMLVMGNGYAKNAIGPQWPFRISSRSGTVRLGRPDRQDRQAEIWVKSVMLIAPNDQGGTDIASVDADAYRRTESKPLKNTISAAPPTLRPSSRAS